MCCPLLRTREDFAGITQAVRLRVLGDAVIVRVLVWAKRVIRWKRLSSIVKNEASAVRHNARRIKSVANP